MPKASVIMGVYNGAQCVDQAIESIINQEFTDWEFIIFDDASTDNTMQILENYQRKDARIKVFKNIKNVGLGQTLNYCIQQTNAPYLVRMDADDISYPNRIGTLTEAMDNDPTVSVISSSATLFESSGKCWGENLLPQPQEKNWVKGSQIIHASSIMRKDHILQVGGYNAKALRVEDYDLWVNLVSKGFKIKTITDKLYSIHWDQGDYNRKKLRFRLLECLVAYKAFRLKSCPWYYFPYIFKSFIVGLIPKILLKNIHKDRFRSINESR